VEFFWSITYIACIYLQYRDKTYSIPILCAFMNLSWEMTFSWILPANGLQEYVNIVWFCLDCIIFTQTIYYGSQLHQNYTTQPLRLFNRVWWIFVVFCFITFISLWWIIYSLAFYQNIDSGIIAYGMNAIMSIMFCLMFLNRKTLKGQSLWIAICKFLGTLFVSIDANLPLSDNEIYWNTFMYTTELISAIFDIIYIFMLIFADRIFEAVRESETLSVKDGDESEALKF